MRTHKSSRRTLALIAAVAVLIATVWQTSIKTTGAAAEGTVSTHVSADAEGDADEAAGSEAGSLTEPPADVEALAATLAITKHSRDLDDAGSTPTEGGMTPEYLAQTRELISRNKAALADRLASLKGRGFDDRVTYIETLANKLVANVEAIHEGRPALLRELAGSAISLRRLSARVSMQLFPAAVTSEDESFNQVMTNLLEEWWAGEGTPPRDKLLRYTHVSDLAASVQQAYTLLVVASASQRPEFVAPTRENYESMANRIKRDIEYLSSGSPSDRDRKVIELAQQMLDEATGENNFFDRLERRLRLVQTERSLISANAVLVSQIQEQIDALALEAQGLDAPPLPTLPTGERRDPGITDDRVLFGQSAAFSGPSRALGEGMNLGIETAFHEANQAGGINGRRIELATLDDGYGTVSAFERTLELISRTQVFGLIGAVGTPTSRAAFPLAQAAGVPFVGPFTGAQFLRDDELTNVINFRASYHQETATMVDLLAEAGAGRVAVLYQNDSFGIDGLTGVRNALDGRDGMEEVASWYYQRNTKAVRSAAFRIAQAEPDAVIIIGSYQPAAELITDLRARLEPDPVFMAVSFVGSNALAEELGEAGEGVYVTQVVPLPKDTGTQIVAEYLKALSAYQPDAEPGFISLEGYIAGRLAVARLQACGSDLSRECFLSVVTDPSTVDIAGLQLEFGPGDNQGSDTVLLTRIGADGEYELVDKVSRS